MAIEVGAVKRRAGLPVWDAEREREVLARACDSNTGPLDESAIIKLFRRIICESRRAEERTIESFDECEIV